MKWIDNLKAERLEKQAKWKDAFEIYKKLAADHKEVPFKLAYRMGYVAEKNKNWKEAEKWLAQAVKAQPDKAQWLYRLGLAQEMNKKYAAAAATYQKALVLSPDKADWVYRLGLTYELSKKFELAAETYQRALELDPAKGAWYLRLGKMLWILGKAADAEIPLRKAMELEPDNAQYAYELAVAIRKQGRTWHEVEALQHAVSLNATNAQWQFELGDASDKMNRFAEAGAAFQIANKCKPGNAIWHFREGWAWERAGKHQQAKAAYAAATKVDKTLKASTLGLGVFHQSRGDWPQAAQTFAADANAQPFNAELQYRLALAYDRCYRWDEAAVCYRKALAMEPGKSDWHYRWGFAQERRGLWLEAAQAYEYAATTNAKHTSYWFYRLGYVLAEAGQYEQACAAFLRTRTRATLDVKPAVKKQVAADASTESEPVDTRTPAERYVDELRQANVRQQLTHDGILRAQTTAAAFYHLGNQAERLEMWGEAAQAYQAAVSRSDSHTGLWYYRLGYVLTQLGRFKEAAFAFRETIIFKRPHGVDTQRYAKPSFLRLAAIYTEYADTLPILENFILYESFAGASIACNPYAIYEKIKDDARFENFTHVWVVNAKDGVSKDLGKNTIFVERGSELYLRYLAQAKYLINNNTFPPYFFRREGQLYLNTWHGTPLKLLGKHIKGGFMEHANAMRNLLQATHMISPNRHTTNVMLEHYDVKELYNGKFAETGYPRIDKTISLDPVKKENLLRRLDTKFNEKVVLYAPTWRGTIKDVQLDVEQLRADIKSMQVPGSRLYFRGHHMFESLLKNLEIDVTVVPADIDSNELLSVVDVLITDYSSIFFDYFPLGRPIIYYTYDLEEYEESRGLYFKMEDLPGEICHDRDELNQVLTKLIDQPVLKGDTASTRQTYSPMEDGRSSERVIDFFFFSKDEFLYEYAKTEKQKILFYQGEFIPNGITSSFLSLISTLDLEKYDVTVVIEPGTVSANEDKLIKFQQLPEKVRVIPRVGSTLMSVEERWTAERYEKYPSLMTENQTAFHKHIYQREYQRIFGGAKFDTIIDFEGYVRFWAYTFAYAPNVKNKIIYLHNDMRNEAETRFPYLNSIFPLYYRYNKLISVSESVNDQNKNSLIRAYRLEESLFDYCNNCVDAEEIINKSKEELDSDLAEWVGDADNVFVTLGRLSPEKDHEKLIDAFSSVVAYTRDAKLVILGEGPLRGYLQRRIDSLGLRDNVLLGGLRHNPFPMLARADCFVFSSNYEGQGIVVLEALILDRPVISTNVVGPRSVLQNGEGRLVDNNSQALADAMLEFLTEKDSWTSTFDYHEYMKDISVKFKSFIQN